jgi:transposase InsO family protein
MHFEGEERNLFRDIRRRMTVEDFEEPVARAANALRLDKSRRSVRSAEWAKEDELLLFRGKVYVPPTGDLRRRIVEHHHDSMIAGHAGRWKTLELVSRNFWWPQMSRYIGQYCRTCDLCNRTKPQRRMPYGELEPSETPKARWERISVDFVVELPEAHGYDAIMTVVDSLSKRAHVVPTHTTISAEGAARLFLREVWKLHGLPRIVMSDRGSQFIGAFTRELYRLLGVRIASSTAYHPQTDGQTERVHQELEQYLRLFVNQRQDDWDDLLPMCEFAYNNHIHSSTQQTPFMLDTGSHPRMGFEPSNPPIEAEGAAEFAERMEKSLEEAKSALDKAKAEYALYYNRHRIPAPTLEPGDMVWLDGSDIATTRPSRKLGHKSLGPFPIEARVGHGAYRLTLPPSLRLLHPVFPIVKLRLAPPDPIEGRIPPPPPPPDLVDGEEEFEVETVLDSRFRYKRLEYLVKWRGYDVGHNMWLPEYNVNAPTLIADFHRRHPGAPRRLENVPAEELLPRAGSSRLERGVL